MVLLQIILATFSITVCVWVAVLILLLKKEIISKITLFLVSFSAGALIGGAFLHLLPEAFEKMQSENIFFITLGAFIFFFFIEKLLHWRHCHNDVCDVHTFGHMSLVGDSIHNFIRWLGNCRGFFGRFAPWSCDDCCHCFARDTSRSGRLRSANTRGF